MGAPFTVTVRRRRPRPWLDSAAAGPLVLRVAGVPVVVENEAGSVRRGTGADGEPWESQLAHHYGYVPGTRGADGDELDAFVGPHPESRRVFVINQFLAPAAGGNRRFDEHKCMLGFRDLDEAVAGYLASYEPGWDGMDSAAEMDAQEFAGWAYGGDRTEPAGAEPGGCGCGG